MEEKNSITISITTLLLIIAIIIIIMMGYLMYRNSVEKAQTLEQISQLNATIQQLETTAHSPSSMDSNTSVSSNTSTTEETNQISKSELINTLDKYLNFQAKIHGNVWDGLIYLGLTNSIDEANTIENDYYILTNVKYEDFENKMLQYVTKEFWAEHKHDKFHKDALGPYFKDSNGYVAVYNGGGSGSEFAVTDVTLLSNKDNLATYTVDYSFSQAEWSEHRTLTATFDLSTGKALISKINIKEFE